MRLLAGAATCAIALAIGGCAHTDSTADRHFAELSDQVGKVQADQDRASQRFAQGEDTNEKPSAKPPMPQASAPTTGALRTVQIGGDADDGQSDDPNDPTARPEIRLTGQGGSAPRPLRGKSTRGKGEADDARVSPSDRSDAASRAPILDPEAKRSYDQALSLVHEKKYDRALESLTSFITRWPEHPYVENALYWRGEVYFARGEHLRAAEQFEAVLARGGAKAPDALLKIGMCHDRLGSADRAKEYWDRLRRDFPRSDAAKKLPQSGDDSRGRGPKESR